MYSSGYLNNQHRISDWLADPVDSSRGIFSDLFLYIMINLSHRDECLGLRSSNLLQWNCRHNWLCTADFTRRRNQQGRLHGELCKHVIHSYLMTEEAAGIGWVVGECCDFSEAELTEASVHACKSWLIIHDLSLTESMHRCLEGNPSHTHACTSGGSGLYY